MKSRKDFVKKIENAGKTLLNAYKKVRKNYKFHTKNKEDSCNFNKGGL